MKKYIILCFTALLSIVGAKSDNVSIPDVAVNTGQTTTVAISLTNQNTGYVSFQMDLTLPSGITINKAGCSLTGRVTDPDQELTIGKQGDNVYRLTSASLGLMPISGNSGALVNLSLSASAASNGRQATLTNIRFATANSERVTMSDVSFTVTANAEIEIEMVDLGLPSGIKWANMNVGANAIEDAGSKYAWGETSPKDEFTVNNYKFGSSASNLTKYNQTDGLTVLQAEDDAATVNMGAGWRIPTLEEWNELNDKCTRQWTTVNGVYGYRFTGSNGNSIFLPVWKATSWMDGAGAYWTSTLSRRDALGAYNIDFDGGSFYIDDLNGVGGDGRPEGRSVRAVYNRLKCAIPTITYAEGMLKFTSETENVTFVSTVTVGEDITSYEDEVPLTPIYRVSVYAKKDGYEDSDVATKDIDFRALRGDVNDDGEITIVDATRIVNIILGKDTTSTSE